MRFYLSLTIVTFSALDNIERTAEKTTITTYHQQQFEQSKNYLTNVIIKNNCLQSIGTAERVKISLSSFQQYKILNSRSTQLKLLLPEKFTI